jgi:outer membrane lipoprotein-sorting protein
MKQAALGSLRRFRLSVKVSVMRPLLWIFLLVVPVRAESVEDATELLQKARAFGESTRSWRAEVVETGQLSGPGMNLQDEVRTRIAVQAPLKMSRQNSGSDQTVLVCDGTETFYSGDGHSYYKGEASVDPQCDLPLSKFYNLDNSPDSVSAVGEDHVRLADGDRRCVMVRAVWKQGTRNTVRTMCIDPSRPLILRDVLEIVDEKTGIRSLKTTTFSDFESNPTFSPDTFRFSIPPGAVEAKPTKGGSNAD